MAVGLDDSAIDEDDIVATKAEVEVEAEVEAEVKAEVKAEDDGVVLEVGSVAGLAFKKLGSLVKDCYQKKRQKKN